MSETIAWNDRYRDGNLPWDTGRPSSELQRVLSANKIQPCRALDIGCGTGTNSVWLAQQGFEATGVDLAPLAVERAKQRAHAAGVKAQFVAADVLHLPDLGGPFAFFFDRGCYHAVRRDEPNQYAPAVAIPKQRFATNSARSFKSWNYASFASTKPPASPSDFWVGHASLKSAKPSTQPAPAVQTASSRGFGRRLGHVARSLYNLLRTRAPVDANPKGLTV